MPPFPFVGDDLSKTLFNLVRFVTVYQNAARKSILMFLVSGFQLCKTFPGRVEFVLGLLQGIVQTGLVVDGIDELRSEGGDLRTEVWMMAILI